MNIPFDTFAQFGKIAKAFLFKSNPIYAHYGITHQCNLKCAICNVIKDNAYQELSSEKIETLCDHLKALGIIYVSVGGGEPLLRKDLVDIIRIFHKKRLRVRLLTNGTLVNQTIVKQLVQNGLQDISISLDTLDPHKQDSIYGLTGSWNKIMHALDLFREALPLRSHILINTVVSPLNIGELPSLASFAQKKGCDISFIPVEAPLGSPFRFQPKDYNAVKNTYDHLLRYKKQGIGSIFNSSIFLQNSVRFLIGAPNSWICDAGKLYISINPQGGVSICHRFRSEISILDNDFLKKFRSNLFQKQQRKLSKECDGCLRPCWAEVSYLMHDMHSLIEFFGTHFSRTKAKSN